MTELEQKIKRRVQMIVVGAVVLFCTLVLTLIIQSSIINAQKQTERKLLATRAALLAEIQDTEALTDYYDSEKFLEEYALYKFGVGRDGAKIFKK
jgi:hypothetical protein